MAKNRKCSYCGEVGHDSRNCPIKAANEPKDKIAWYKIEGLSDSEADNMTSAIMKAKRKIAPNAQAAYVKADKKTLPQRVAKRLGIKEDDEEN